MPDLSVKYKEIKHKLFEKADTGLNDMQKKAVYTTDGPLLVFAGAGSGKTTVLVHRVAQIIRYGNGYFSDRVPADLSEQTLGAYNDLLGLEPADIRPILEDFRDSPCPPWNVLAITFTNKAANEIKTRLAKMFDDPETAESIWTGTFHSVCMRLLRMYPDEFGVSKDVTIYDTDDQKKVLGSVMKDMEINDKQYTLKSCTSVISKAKEKLQTPDGYMKSVGFGFREKVYGAVYAEYQRRLEKANALDFDDIIMVTVRMLKANAELREKIASRFRYICVDEYQDTNPAQFELCEALSSVHRNLMAVGDDDQSIYKFRGATIENILNFEKAFPGAKIIKLEQNYRSTSNILNAANAVISKNGHKYPKKLWTDSGEGEKIHIEKVPGEAEEAKKIIDVIQEKVASGEYHYKDFAVLYRVNAQANIIENTFSRSGMPFRVLGGMRFNDRKEIKDVFAYLQLINNHADSVRLQRIVNEPRRSIGDATMKAVAAIANETGKTQFEVMEHAISYAAIARSADKLGAFCAVINRLTEIYREGCPLDAFVNQVLDMTGYRQMLIDGGEADKDHLANVEELVSGVIQYMNENEEPTLNGFLELNALASDVDKYDENADAVVMMTIHSAKGLEFPVTFLPGMEEGLFPSALSSMDESEVEEERRLAYVAITRAKKEVYIYYARKRVIYGKLSFNPLSRFVRDIPDNLCDKHEDLPEDDMFSDSFGGSYFGGARGGSSYGSYGRGGYSGGARRPESPRTTTYHFDDIPGGTDGLKPRTSVPGGDITVGAKKITHTIPVAREVFNCGDRVKHPSFGAGTVLTVKEMGSDRMYEIAFDDAGTKKLMASYAKLSRENG